MYGFHVSIKEKKNDFGLSSITLLNIFLIIRESEMPEMALIRIRSPLSQSQFCTQLVATHWLPLVIIFDHVQVLSF